ncbi:MAG: ribosomal protein S18-alanine N-acetyltransferase [Clostridiaceae bacterium]|nr:ribosomal protein S18-alanine N-acetyltransferase [Clostridiales bacterium]MDD2441803.1 ribosomal protein S18-alanine N-acetyltransferase [Eubacteriales bacterium]MDD4140308.1 ribosomal protein S18-alanine N-acetyltransferase [Eubacteriales bacterium]MDD4743676.1 ribosomal protein S18-alanine N-acetyltransferase [Eubacteriales bacterium]NLB43703.1 ribosomal protein S18-alanine N-acetyltransferase [Clostridiaceae bacterium]
MIRPAEAGDLPALAALEKDGSGLPWSLESLTQDLAGNPAARYWVACDQDNRPVAYLACHVVLDEADLVNLVVCPALRRRGIGRKLLQYMQTQLAGEGVHKLFLDVREHNAPALQLYRWFGCRAVGRRAAYYGDTGESAIIMLKEFGQNDEYIIQHDNK